ncbi:hypothetical protein [Spiroplasma endosymbiont of Thecophora atra]
MLYLYNKSENTDYIVLITAESEVEDPTFVASKSWVILVSASK